MAPCDAHDRSVKIVVPSAALQRWTWADAGAAHGIVNAHAQRAAINGARVAGARR